MPPQPSRLSRCVGRCSRCTSCSRTEAGCWASRWSRAALPSTRRRWRSPRSRSCRASRLVESACSPTCRLESAPPPASSPGSRRGDLGVWPPPARVSLAESSGGGEHGSIAGILAWLGGSAALALVVLTIGSRRDDRAAAFGVAGGLLFSIGDISTKLATQGGAHFAFVVTLIIGYTLGTSLIQLGYQRGGALTVAGLATLCTNALPIAAATIVLHEPVPSGILGGARVVAFIAVTAGSILLSEPDSAGTSESRKESHKHAIQSAIPKVRFMRVNRTRRQGRVFYRDANRSDQCSRSPAHRFRPRTVG